MIQTDVARFLSCDVIKAFCGIKTYKQRAQILYYAASCRYIQYCSEIRGQ